MKAKIKLPESLREITLAQYQYFLSKAEGLEGEELKAAMLECFALINPDKIRIIEKGSVDEIAEHIDGLFIGERELVQKFELKGFKFGFIPELDKMSFGEYIDLDKYIGDWKEMHRAMAVLYRPITTEIKEQYNVVDYEGTDEYAELMKLMPLDAVLSAQVFFLEFRKRIVSSFADLFRDGGETDYSARAQFGKKWGWYSSIYQLAKGDIRNFDAITRTPIRQALTYLTFEQEKQRIENNEIKKSIKR